MKHIACFFARHITFGKKNSCKFMDNFLRQGAHRQNDRQTDLIPALVDITMRTPFPQKNSSKTAQSEEIV